MRPMPRKARRRLFGPSLRERCPMGPPYVILVLDEETAEALTYGVANSRAVVEAFRALEAVKSLPLPKDYPA